MTDLAIDVVKAATESIGAQAWKEISLIWGFEGQLDNLKKKFSNLQKLLEEKEKDAKNDSPFVSHLLQEVKDVAYLADNVMDDYDYEIIRRKVELGKNLSCKKKVRNFFTCTNNPIVFRIRMTHKILEILSKFDELYKGVEQTKQTREALKQPTTFYDKDTQSVDLDEIRQYIAPASEFVGRKEDKEWLLHKMCNSTSNEENLSIIAVVGFGGLGKTTLARAVYDHEKVKQHFDKRVWICVSEDFSIKRLLKEMVEILSSKKCDLTYPDVIKQELQKELENKKYLLVLDDVWSEDNHKWDSLKSQLKEIGGTPGGVILVTTRVENVAKNAGDAEPYKLKGLSDEDSWALFKNKANIPSPSFENVGKKIVDKCKGVPLAITTIGRLLSSMKTIPEWESIEKSEVWNATSEDSQKNYIMPSLLLSYNHLPSLSFKQCFAYCAIFPKDRRINKNELIDLWIAQGFLVKAGTTNTFSEMEKMGEKCFNTLLNMFFLQLEVSGYEAEENIKRGIWVCKMHDLVHDLATHIFEKDMFVWDGKVEPDTNFNYRHLVLNFNEEESERIDDKVVNEEIIMQQVRTVNIWSGEPCWDMLKQTRYLRTLIMDGIRIKDELPSIIGESKHLRYLDLSSNSIETLPDSICRLYQLQALILLNTKLRELPRDLHRLVSLKRLEISFCVCQRLPIIVLGRLPHLRGLCLYNFSKVECIGEEVDDINHQSNGIQRSNLNRDVKDFFPSLRELRIRDFRNLKTLNLVPSTNATTSVVKPLFPCLEILEIIRCGKLEVVKTSPTLSFESLKILYLDELPGIEEPVDIIRYHKSGSLTCLIVTEMPEMRSLPEALSYCTRLERLEIERCPKLVCLPAGMNSLVSLKEVSIMWCPKLECLPAGMNSLVSLKEVIIEYCDSLVSIPDDMFKGSSSLRKLIIHFCPRLEKIPSSLAECTSLEDLQILGCTSLKHPIPDLSSLQCLVSLEVNRTTSMAAFKLEWIPCLPRLQYLKIELFPVEDEIESKRRRQFSNEDHIDIDIDNGTSFRNDSLVRLMLLEPMYIDNKFKSLPRQLLQLHLPNLKRLNLSGFKELEGLPDEWIGTLSSLEELRLQWCKNLRFLPSKKNLSQLQCLIIIYCPKLEERIMAKDGGLQSEWHKVSHVPNIQINYETIQDLKR